MAINYGINRYTQKVLPSRNTHNISVIIIASSSPLYLLLIRLAFCYLLHADENIVIENCSARLRKLYPPNYTNGARIYETRTIRVYLNLN